MFYYFNPFVSHAKTETTQMNILQKNRILYSKISHNHHITVYMAVVGGWWLSCHHRQLLFVAMMIMKIFNNNNNNNNVIQYANLIIIITIYMVVIIMIIIVLFCFFTKNSRSLPSKYSRCCYVYLSMLIDDRIVLNKILEFLFSWKNWSFQVEWMDVCVKKRN